MDHLRHWLRQDRRNQLIQSRVRAVMKVFVERRQLREDLVFGVLLFGAGAEGDGASVGVDGSVNMVVMIASVSGVPAKPQFGLTVIPSYSHLALGVCREDSRVAAKCL